jgi:hypothetical protein
MNKINYKVERSVFGALFVSGVWDFAHSFYENFSKRRIYYRTKAVISFDRVLNDKNLNP